ncbi:MAG: winged helix-turn-helix transcriptional regulator [Desulfitobacterium sp.]|nr:winged helix-turn-helix transcriptional regulator [Desulfitobacterium sp.]
MSSINPKYTEVAEVLKALAHPVRICIVNNLLEKGECNVSEMQDCLGAPQSTVSQHLQRLRLADIVTSRRVGLEVYYSIKNPRVGHWIREILNSLNFTDK